LERSLCIPYVPPHQATGAEVSGFHMAYLRQPVPPVFNSRHSDEIFMDLAERLGILYGKRGLYDALNHKKDMLIWEDGFYLGKNKYELDLNQKYTLKEIFDRQLRSWSHGDGRGYEDLCKTGFMKFPAPKKHWYQYYFMPGKKTRHPFYFEFTKRCGDTLRANLRKYNLKFPGIDDEDYVFDQYKAIPYWIENSEINAPAEYDLWALNWKTPYYAHDPDNVCGNPWLNEMSRIDGFDAGIFLNSATAKKKGLKDGDLVTIESRYGKAEGKVKVTELIHPDAVGIPGSHGLGTVQSTPLEREGANFNALLSIDEHTLDIISAGQELSPRVKIYKSGVN
jgi:anaerobic selenocysteine-containing dehydrogenase